MKELSWQVRAKSLQQRRTITSSGTISWIVPNFAKEFKVRTTNAGTDVFVGKHGDSLQKEM
jgi:hypothetical protein